MDMDSCLLSEKPKSAIQAEDIEIQPELQPLPIPLRPLTEIKRVHTTNLVHAAPVGKVSIEGGARSILAVFFLAPNTEPYAYFPSVSWRDRAECK